MSDFKSLGTEIHCPHCSSMYLHLRTVHVITRNTEDNNTGLFLKVNVEQATFVGATNAELCKSRRDETTLVFWCEECGNDSTLTFQQHKGLTQIV